MKKPSGVLLYAHKMRASWRRGATLRLQSKRFLLCLSQRTVARKGKKATAGEWNNFLVSIRINTQSVALYGKERET